MTVAPSLSIPIYHAAAPPCLVKTGEQNTMAITRKTPAAIRCGMIFFKKDDFIDLELIRQNNGFLAKPQVTGCWMLVADQRCKMQDAGCKMQYAGYWLLKYSLSFLVCRSLFVVCSLKLPRRRSQRTPLAVANDFNREAIGSVNGRRKAN
jgi:hypothetical protein